MKKSVSIFLSITLVLMLVLSVLPMGALAAEADEEASEKLEYIEAAADLTSTEQGAVELMAVCGHIYTTTVKDYYSSFNDHSHSGSRYYVYACIYCVHSYEEFVDTFTANHYFVEEYCKEHNEETNTDKYYTRYDCPCGFSYDDYIYSGPCCCDLMGRRR